jgi:hypothetical protein
MSSIGAKTWHPGLLTSDLTDNEKAVFYPLPLGFQLRIADLCKSLYDCQGTAIYPIILHIFARSMLLDYT